MLKYTICFLKRGHEVLMLNRSKPPGMGRWNGVGGKLEPGETPEQNAFREIHEETGILVSDLVSAGHVHWINAQGVMTGAHLFVANLPVDFQYAAPRDTAEGILAWKTADWLLDKQNKGIISHLQLYLGHVLEQRGRYEFVCTFNAKDEVVDFQVSELHNVPLTGA
ncbi:NUDIX hydrolase [Paenibacillus cremeus]|uniref:8-oxo-dGTP diphosphatase n=1 Tax=Paenibacillus cremeus TaxID=2163881 RepID=A0A559KDS6_9BACL|nr:8-oxo-dGTP diphosphatase [Paenibacillus cremeus]TVY10268.1 8-oxo-dGTP diphosphatase [Paenibacillus cremeus]